MLQESQHGLYGFAAPPTPITSRRRARSTEDENSVSTPARSTRSATAATRERSHGRFISSSPVHNETTNTTTTTSSTEECNVCFQPKIASEQKRCAACQQMLCVTCAQEVIARANTEYFDCPFCRGHFVNDIIDLFAEE